MAKPREIQFKDLGKELKKFESRVSRKIVRDSLKKSGLKLLADIKNLAPYRTGQLRTALELSIKNKRKSISAAVGTTDEGYYWKFLEYGTKRMKAQPWIRKLFDSQEEQIIRDIEKSIETDIKENF